MRTPFGEGRVVATEQAAEHAVGDEFDPLLQRPPFETGIVAVRDFEGGRAVDSGVEGLGDEVGVFEAVRQPARGDGLGDGRLQKGVTVLIGVLAVLHHRIRHGRQRIAADRRHEHEAVVVRVRDGESDVRTPQLADPLHRVGDPRELQRLGIQAAVVMAAELEHQVRLVLEMDVDRSRRIVDRRGDLAHRDGVVPFLHKQLPRGVHDQASDFVPLPLPAFLRWRHGGASVS